ncbi:MAG TPA: FHA domain-containing protein, partial [Polyangiaceae bacterium]|nr:FHA domain-containing protein [Polyangiaceae bacterium]
MAHRQAQGESGARGTGDSGLHARSQPTYALREGTVHHPLNQRPLLIGRGSDSDIVLTGPLVSRRHAEFHQTEAGVVVIDLGSQNGVLVNGSPIAGPTALLLGDKVTVGDDEFELTELPAERAERISGFDRNPDRDSARVPAGTTKRMHQEASVATRRADVLHLL